MAKKADKPTSSADRLLANYADAFESPSGQVVLDDLRSRLGGQSFNVNKPDPYVTAFMEGQRAVLLFIESNLIEARRMKDGRRDEQPVSDGLYDE